MEEKKTVAVLFGGVSSEHDISLISAANVIGAIDKGKYNVIQLGISKTGEWFIFTGSASELPNDNWLKTGETEKASISPDRAVHGIVTESGEKIYIDAAFPVLHGKNGEDGSVQGLLQLAGIPCVGCGMVSSAVCMDKEFTNALADAGNVPQASWMSVKQKEFTTDEGTVIQNAIEKLGFPIFVKPANAGSSVGISKAKDVEGLHMALISAFKEDEKVVLESSITGAEVECAVLGNEDLVTGEVGQIIAGAEFYDYDAKYNSTESKTLVPAEIPPEKRNEVRERAKEIFKLFGCKGMARVDFFVEEGTGRVLFNEINTIPGQTEISMYPMMLQAVGIEYSALVGSLIELALEGQTAKR